MLKTQPSHRVFPRFQRMQCWKRGKIQIVIRRKSALYARFLFYGSRKEKRKTARFKRIPAKLFHLPHLPLHLLLIPLRGTRYPFEARDTSPWRLFSWDCLFEKRNAVAPLRPNQFVDCKRFCLAKANQRNLCDPPRFFKADPFIFYSSIR